MNSGQAWSEQKYDRKIKYLDYLENGVRVRGVGFVKLELRDGRCNMHLQISGLYRRDHFTRSLMLLADGEERELCRLQLAEGSVKTSLDGLDSRNLDGHGLCYDQVTGLRIQISEGKEIRCLWGEEPVQEREQRQEMAFVREELTEQKQKATAQEEILAQREEESEQGNVTGRGESAQESVQRQEISRGEALKEQTPEEFGDWAAPPVVHEDKWAQLWAIYPHIEPFHDGREYMSMGPGDFVILPGRHYKLVNNSFLLHGYYNYHHLIMTRVEERSDVKYYIGVPGNYYEREKKIAVMFGFENFECGAEPAEEGDFGYYMTPVEL